MAGEINVDAMLRRITAKQFRGWEAFDALEPGALRLEYAIASVVQVVANVNRSKGQKPISLDECLLRPAEAPKRHQTPEEQLAIFRIVGMAFQAKAIDA